MNVHATKREIAASFFLMICPIMLRAQDFITTKNETNAFPIVTSSQTCSIYIDSNDDWLVHKRKCNN